MLHKYRFYIFWTIILVILFAVRFDIHARFHRPLLDEFLGKTFEGRGIVVEEPEEKSFYTEMIVKVSGAEHAQKILVQAPFYPDFEYGDEVMVKGKLKYPKDFKTDAGHIFPYQKFLAKDDIYYLLSSPTITLVSKDKGNPIKAFLFDIKQSFVSRIQKIIPRPESSLLSGMLIAGKGGLGKDLEDQFKQVGLIHIVVLSGYNVTIVAEAFIRMLSFLPRVISYSAGTLGIILFGVMAGGGSTIIRASFMSIVALVGKLTGNTYSALRALIAGGVIMVFINPLILRYDPSFQLSFMATFALIALTPYVQKWMGKFGQTIVGEMAASTLAVEAFLFPYLLWMNGYFAFVSFPANILVLAFLPFAMLAGFIATLISYAALSVSYPFSMVSFIVLRYILRIVEIASHFTFVSVGWIKI